MTVHLPAHVTSDDESVDESDSSDNDSDNSDGEIDNIDGDSVDFDDEKQEGKAFDEKTSWSEAHLGTDPALHLK